MPAPRTILARARSDSRDWLTEAEQPLLNLQLHAGGEMPGIIAAPALRDLVRRARLYRLRLAECIYAQDGDDRITAWVEAAPNNADGGCDLTVSSWRVDPAPVVLLAEDSAASLALIRQIAELSLRLGPDQEILAVQAYGAELAPLAGRMALAVGRPWTDFVDISGDSSHPLDRHVMDGSKVVLTGSGREWTMNLVPIDQQAGFELHFTSDIPPFEGVPSADAPAGQSGFNSMMGREIAPVLRQPIARIIANAETIRARLAGPLADEYSAYASDIASAGQHLLALIDDLTDLEVVEDHDFTTAPDRIDLADLCRRAAGILGVRARERGINIEVPKASESAPAIGEFRRVLQVLLNLVSNAIRYSPEGSQVWLRVERVDGRARIIVADQGEGLSEEQQGRLFEKFERLGRGGDGGSGLGLYISRKLAHAMNGELTVESAPGEGARFMFDLPADTEG